MATINQTNPTFSDIAKRTDPDGKIAPIVELLNEHNEILLDATAIEANDKTSHLTTVRSGLPSVTWTKFYQGVQPGKSTTVQVRDAIGMAEMRSSVDERLLSIAPDASAFRLSEDRPFIEAISQDVASTVFYGDTGPTPEKFNGLSQRFSSTSAENGINIVNAGGSGSDNTSIWLVVWSPNTCHMIYPRGSKAGVEVTDLGRQRVEDANGGVYEAMETKYIWKTGLSVRDWRYVVRIANIDVSDLGTLANTKNIINWMIEASEAIPSLSTGRAAFYCNKTIRTKLRFGINEKTTNQLTYDTVAGKRVMAFDGIPVRRCDKILNTEAAIS